MCIRDRDESGQEKIPDVSGAQNDNRDDDVPESEAAHSCYVHICGEVISPGVYQLSEGDRVFQAVEAAGGFTKEASEESLNCLLYTSRCV